MNERRRKQVDDFVEILERLKKAYGPGSDVEAGVAAVRVWQVIQESEEEGNG